MRNVSVTGSDGRAIILGICTLAGLGPVRSVLVCDDRPVNRQKLSDMLWPLPTLMNIACVSDGFELVDAHASEPADLVLIGCHGYGVMGEQAMGLILGMDPTAAIIVVGSVNDAHLLATALVRGARGLLLWDGEFPDLA